MGGKRPGAGRPATGREPVRTVRLSDEFMSKLDDWAARQEDKPTRSEAIRRLVELGLTLQTGARPKNEGQRQRASEMAGNAIDKMSDGTASEGDQNTRKRRLIKGPEEFQKVRRDRNRK